LEVGFESTSQEARRDFIVQTGDDGNRAAILHACVDAPDGGTVVLLFLL
jgi:hypothetical protein